MLNDRKPCFELAGSAATPPTTWSYWVVEGHLLAGAYPGSPKPDEHRSKIQSLLNAGVRTFINLMEEDETNGHGQPFAAYDDLARELSPNANCRRFAVEDQYVPSKALMAEILDEIDRTTANGTATYIHCWGGVGRTGTAVACWLLRHGFAKPENVLDVLQQLRRQDQERGWRDSPENDEQRQFVFEWSEGQ